jgi:hypothetical protein
MGQALPKLCFYWCRRVDDGRPEVPVEAGWTSTDCEGPPPAQVHPGEVRLRLLQHQDQHRPVIVLAL